MSTIEYMREWRKNNKTKIQGYNEYYRNRNRQIINARVSAWKRSHRDEKRRKQGRDAYYRNHENRLRDAKNSRLRHPEYFKKMRDKYRDEFADCYVRKTLYQKSDLSSFDIPIEIVNAKREVMRLRRSLNERRK